MWSVCDWILTWAQKMFPPLSEPEMSIRSPPKTVFSDSVSNAGLRSCVRQTCSIPQMCT